MKKSKKYFSIIIIISMITSAVLPITMAVSANATTGTGFKFEEKTVNAITGIYKLVFSVKTPTNVKSILTVLSFDNTVIQPVDWENGYVSANTTVAPESPFKPTATNFTIARPDWLKNGGRTAFNITVLRASGGVNSNSSYVEIFEFYYKRTGSESDCDSSTFMIEDGSKAGGFVQQFFPSGDGCGIAITNTACETFYWGVEDTMPYSTIIAEISKAYINSTVNNRSSAKTDSVLSNVEQSADIVDNETNDVVSSQIEPASILSLQTDESNERLMMCTVTNITSFSTTTFKITYNPAQVQILDFAAQTPGLTVEPGFVSETDLSILSHDTTTGQLTFKVNKTIQSGKMWSGVLTILRLKERIPGAASALTFTEINNGVPNSKIITGKAISLAVDKRPATVTLTSTVPGSAPLTTYTDANGIYIFENVPAGNYTLKISKISYLSYTKQVLTVGDIDILYKDITLIPGDIDGNGYVNYNDLTLLLADYNKIGADISNPAADIDGNGQVNYNDQTALLSGYNKSATVE